MFEIRLADKKDCSRMLDIYVPVIEQTAISFEFEVPTLEQFETRVSGIQQHYPWLVCTDNDYLAGYAYAGPHRSRKAYQWSVELSVYVNPGNQRRGIARALYTALIEVVKRQGFFTALAGITLPNQGSVRFHEACGFKQVGIYHNVGYKFDRWHSVGWWEYPLRLYETAPRDPLAVDAVMQWDHWNKFMKSCTDTIKTGV